MAYTVFHTTEAGKGAYFVEYARNGWAFEPAEFKGLVYSMVYNSREEAEEAARSIFCLEEIEASR